MRDMDVRRLVLGAAISLGVLVGAPAAANAASAVVLVSGFDTSSPFSSSAPACAGQEGPTWGDPNGPAAALRAAGYAVFTAPVANAGAQPPAPCAGAGQATPPASATIDSNGDVDVNGQALATLLAFLQTSYDVDTVQLVAHSDGGLWSRSAITQLPAGAASTVKVQSLTTLGTPHTGSFGADLAETVTNGQCDESNTVEQIVCDAVLDLIKAEFATLGNAAIEQLSSTFLAGWNPQQTLGCPVTVMGGTWLDIPLIPFEYYDPSDGIVGEASALAESATSITLQPIPAPGFTAVGRLTFPVVHSSMLEFLSPNTLLDQASISAAVVESVAASANAAPCYAPPAGPAPSPPADITPPPAVVEPLPQPLEPPTATAAFRAGTAAAPVVTRAGFRAVDTAGPRGRLPRPTRGEVVLLTGGARLSCRGRRVPSAPLLGSKRLQVAAPKCSTRLRVRGGRALALRPDPRRGLRVTRDGRTLTLRATGAKLRRVRARVRANGRWRRVPIGATTLLPPGTERVSVRVVGRDRSGEQLAATAHVAG